VLVEVVEQLIILQEHKMVDQVVALQMRLILVYLLLVVRVTLRLLFPRKEMMVDLLVQYQRRQVVVAVEQLPQVKRVELRHLTLVEQEEQVQQLQFQQPQQLMLVVVAVVDVHRVILVEPQVEQVVEDQVVEHLLIQQRLDKIILVVEVEVPRGLQVHQAVENKVVQV
jgi:hypothetical protein